LFSIVDRVPTSWTEEETLNDKNKAVNKIVAVFNECFDVIDLDLIKFVSVSEYRSWSSIFTIQEGYTSPFSCHKYNFE